MTPFNDLAGRPAVLALLKHTRHQIRDVRFHVIDQITSGQRVYLKWEMTGRLRLLGVWQVEGMSELLFDEEGKLKQHLDYWDASEQFYGRLPVIGRVLRRIRFMASVPAPLTLTRIELAMLEIWTQRIPYSKIDPIDNR